MKIPSQSLGVRRITTVPSSATTTGVRAQTWDPVNLLGREVANALFPGLYLSPTLPQSCGLACGVERFDCHRTGEFSKKECDSQHGHCLMGCFFSMSGGLP